MLKKRDFYLTICNYVTRHNSLPNPISIGISKQAMNYYVRKLKIDGIIKKLGYGTWELDKDKYEQWAFIKQVKKTHGASSKQLDLFTSLKKRIRGHGFILTFKLPKGIPAWDKRESLLERKGIKFKVIGSNWHGQSIKIRGFKVWLTPKSIVIYLPKHRDYFHETADEARKYVIYDMVQIAKNVENLLGISLKIMSEYRFRVSRQHYARLDDEIARQYRRDGKHLTIRDEGGVWCITDYSWQRDELETVHKDTAQRDMDGVITPVMNDFKHYYEKMGEPLLVSNVLQIATKNALFLQEYAENIAAHTQAIKRMADLLDRIEKRLNGG